MCKTILCSLTVCTLLLSSARFSLSDDSVFVAADNAAALNAELNRPLSSITLKTHESGEILPKDRYAELKPEQNANENRGLHPVNYNWVAPGLYHNPLYTEDVTLERYGWSYGPCVQPFVSATKFATDSFFMPYQMGLDSPRECKTTLGYYRPGSCAPNVRKRLPFSWKASALQAGAMIGTGALFK